MTTRTAEEARAHNVSVMGKAVGDVYSALWQELALINRNWNEYVALYGTKPSRVELLNRAAPSFFRVVQDALWEQTVLHIARLTDPAVSFGKPNLSIQRLLAVIDRDDIKATVAPKVEVALTAAVFARDWRNRRIAHRDLAVALYTNAQPIAPASRAMVREAIDRLADVLNAVSLKYMDSESAFDGTWYPGGAVSLLHIVNDGLETRHQRNDRIKRGEASVEDFQRKDL
jgi:hypothetical protein